MPLAFESISHGPIAFGFFNIESDLLLLDHYFFFATDFGDLVKNLAASKGMDGSESLSWQISLIETADDIGDLMGAIHGVRFTGFIGDVYRRYPFPQNSVDFKQKPEGFNTQPEITALIKPYALANSIRVSWEADGSAITIGDYHFDRRVFQQLLDYVWLGGYPRWKDDVRPDYVESMRECVLSSAAALFNGAKFS